LLRFADHPRVVAIGETGLDYYRLKGDLTWQQERFRRHIRARARLRKPLVIHTREAAADTLRIMREEGAGKIGGVMHCFTESWDMARAALDLGFYVSFPARHVPQRRRLREVARQVPEDRLLVETDARIWPRAAPWQDQRTGVRPPGRRAAGNTAQGRLGATGRDHDRKLLPAVPPRSRGLMERCVGQRR